MANASYKHHDPLPLSGNFDSNALIDAFLGGIPLPFKVANLQDIRRFLLRNAPAITDQPVEHLIENDLEDQSDEQMFGPQRNRLIVIDLDRLAQILDLAAGNGNKLGQGGSNAANTQKRVEQQQLNADSESQNFWHFPLIRDNTVQIIPIIIKNRMEVDQVQEPHLKGGVFDDWTKEAVCLEVEKQIEEQVKGREMDGSPFSVTINIDRLLAVIIAMSDFVR